MDLNEVRMFVQVVRAGSFAGAARRLGIPPNTLSRRVRRLESALKTRLLQRSTRLLTLTQAGQSFYERCAPAMDGVMEAGRELRDGHDVPNGIVRVAAPADFLDLFRIEWLAEYLARFPQVRFEFLLSDQRADLIAERIDVAFRAGPTHADHILYQRIGPQSARLVASPEYLERRTPPRDLAALAQHDCLLHACSADAVTWTLEGPKGSESVRVQGRLAVSSARTLLRCCLEGLGIALLPEMLMAEEQRAGRLLAVLPEYRRAGPGFNVILPSRQHIPMAVASFVEFAAQRLRTIVPEGHRPRAAATIRLEHPSAASPKAARLGTPVSP